MLLIEIVIYTFLYAQIINVFETLLWVRSFWRLRKISQLWGSERVPRDAYHAFLAVLYILPFIPWGLTVALECALIVWLLNDLTWHFWSVHPKSWFKWFKSYFNPFGHETLWYARLGITRIKITPKRMFWATVFRV
ncbi:MAG: hypothetical protein DRJ59_02155, partial [Thermoprotei archaeon]